MSFYDDIRTNIKILVPILNNTSSSSIVNRIISTVASVLNIVKLRSAIQNKRSNRLPVP